MTLPCTRRNERAHDNVFFESVKRIHLTGNRCFRKHFGRFLEGSGRNKRIGCKSSLGNSKQYGFSNCGLSFPHNCFLLVLTLHFRIDLTQTSAIDHFPNSQIRIARIGNNKSIIESIVHFFQNKTIYVVVLEEVGIPRIENAHFLHHLTHNTLDVLVVDGHAL